MGWKETFSAKPAAERHKNAAHGASRGSEAPGDQALKGRKRNTSTIHSLQAFLSAGEVVGQRERGTIFFRGSLAVTLLFRQLSDHAVDFEDRSCFRWSRRKIAAQQP